MNNNNKGKFLLDLNWFFPIVLCIVAPALGELLIAAKIIAIIINKRETKKGNQGLNYDARYNSKNEDLRKKYGSNIEFDTSVYERPTFGETTEDLINKFNREKNQYKNYNEAKNNGKYSGESFNSYANVKEEKVSKSKSDKSKRTIIMIGAILIGVLLACFKIDDLGWAIEELFDGYTLTHYLIPSLAGMILGCGLVKWGIGYKKDGDALENLKVIIGNRPYISIKTLEAITGYSHKKLIKLIKKGISKGSFEPTSYLDIANDMLVIRGMAPQMDEGFSQNQGNDTFDKFFSENAKTSAAFNASSLENGDSKTSAAKDRNENSKTGKSAYNESDEYEKILLELHDINEDIPGEEMSEKISQLESLCSKIFDEARKNPQKKDMLGRFMNYYLPTSKKLLTTYATLDKQGDMGDNIKETKENIENNMDALINAFSMQLDKLFEADAMDVSADIATLNKMFDMDGMKGNEFENLTR